MTAKTISSASWQTLSILGQRGLSLLSTLVLARIVAPSAFGLLGMAMVVIAALDSFKDLGTSSALIQRKEFTDELASTLFWTNVLLGMIGAGLMVGVAPQVAGFYRQPQVTVVLEALALSFFFNNLGVVHRAILVRAMLFRRLSGIHLTAALVSALAGIGMAIAGAGVWSLVVAVVCEAATAVALYWVVSSWRPRWRLNLRELRSVAAYSANLTGARFNGYLMRNIDKALIGRYLGATALGYYSLAYGLMMYPVYNVSWNLAQVLLPAFSRIQDENARFREAYLRSVTVIATVTFPLMLGLLVTADLVVLTFFGRRWAPMAPLVMILAPAGMLLSITTNLGVIYSAKGRTDLMFRWGMVESAVVVTAFAVGLHWGTTGMAMAYLMASFLLCAPAFAIAGSLIQMRFRDIARALRPTMRNALGMTAAALLMRLGLPRAGVEGPGSILAVTTAVGAITYGALLLRSRPPVLLDVLRLLPLRRVPWMRRLTAYMEIEPAGWRSAQSSE